jgi:Putative auto-transporter adhesin, head GIN domain
LINIEVRGFMISHPVCRAACRITVPFVAAALIALVTTYSQATGRVVFDSRGQVVGSGKIVEMPRKVAAFDRVEVRDGIRATLRRGNEAKLTVSADDNIEPLVETVVEGSTLVLRMKPKTSMRTKHRMSVAVVYTTLEKIAAHDGSSIEADAMTAASFVVQVSDGASLKADSVSAARLEVSVADGASAKLAAVRGSETLSVRVSDGAKLVIDAVVGGGMQAKVSDGASLSLRGVDVKSLDVSASDGASAALSGSAMQQNFVATDGASINARELTGESARVRATDGGALKAGALKSLDVEVDESASVRYAGEPTVTLRSRDKRNVRKY